MGWDGKAARKKPIGFMIQGDHADHWMPPNDRQRETIEVAYMQYLEARKVARYCGGRYTCSIDENGVIKLASRYFSRVVVVLSLPIHNGAEEIDD